MAKGISNSNGKCRIRYQRDGKTYQPTLDIPYTPSGIKKAQKIREQFIRAALRGDTTGKKIPSFGSLAQTRLNSATLTPESRRTQKLYLNNYWGEFFLIPISEIHYSDLLDVFSKVDKSAKTLKNIISSGSSVFELAIRSGYRSDNPCSILNKDIKLNRKTIDPFTADERDQILDSLDGGPHIFFMIRFYAGLRPSEAIALRWSDYKDGEFHINKTRVKGHDREQTKTNLDRVVTVHPKIQKALAALPRQLNDPHIVVNQYGRAYRSATRLSVKFTQATKSLGIRHRSPYNVRHTCASMMLENGLEPAWAAEQLGHTKEVFFRVYTGLVNADKNAEQSKIWALVD